MKELVGVNAKQRAKQEVDAQKETTEAVAKATMAVNKSAKTPIGPINKVTAAVKRVREAIVANSKTTKAAKDTTGAVNKVKDAVDKSSKAQKGLVSEENVLNPSQAIIRNVVRLETERKILGRNLRNELRRLEQQKKQRTYTEIIVTLVVIFTAALLASSFGWMGLMLYFIIAIVLFR